MTLKIEEQCCEYTVSRKENQFPTAFPKKWSCSRSSRDDVECQVFDINKGSKLITKSRLNSRFWSGQKLYNLLDSWNFPLDDNTLCIWRQGDKEADEPLGFIAFSFGISKENFNEQISGHITLSLDLAWVRLYKRGLGVVVARHLATHFLYYLDDCSPSELIGPDEEWSFCYSADYDSRGGEKFSKLIEQQIHYIKEIQLWHGFKHIYCDTGW